MSQIQRQTNRRALWIYFVEPRASILSPQRRLRMRLLAILLIILTPMVIFSAASGVGPQPEDGFSLWIMALFLATAYGLSRTVHYLPAVILAVAAVTIEPFFMIIFSTNFNPNFVIFTSLFLLVGITLGSIMLPFAGLVFLISIDILGLLALPWIAPQITYFTIANSLLLIIVISSLTIIAARVRTQDLYYIEKQALKIRENEARIQSLLEATFEGIIIQKDGIIEDTNPAFETLFGYSAVETIGQRLDQFIVSTTHESFDHQLNQAQKIGEQLHQLEVKGCKNDGSTFDVEIKTKKGHQYLGQSVQVFAFQDISKHKQAEQALTQAKEVAEAANAAKSDFLANVSHELRTPLTSILGFAKIIQKRLHERIFPAIPDATSRVTRTINQVSSNLDIIQAEGQRLTTLINNVLDLEKIESGKMDWRMETLSVAELIEQAVAATDALFKEKDLHFIQEVPANLPDIVGDHDKLIQVIINLISNAIKFTNQGTITCQAETTQETVIIHIIDEGVGIKADDLPLVFEKFKQVGDTLTDKPHGTGLGLPICKQIVEYHGGQIWAQSTLEQGSTFAFSLPVMGTATQSDAQAWTKAINIDLLVEQLEAHGVRNLTEQDQNKQKTVLVIDDEPHIRELLRQELSAKGYRVMEAKDGVEAIAQTKRSRPDLITLDIMMPEMNGFDVAAVLRNDPQTATIPIIILSIVQDQTRGYRLGVDRYLTKPFDTETLLSEVETLLSQGHSKKKVLIVDEDISGVKMLSDVLQTQGYSVSEVIKGENLLEKALSIKPDMIIVNAALSENQTELQSLRFEKGLEHVLLFFFQGQSAMGEIEV